jgi:ribosomal protein S18 acetylase RimI-like enzyme
MGSGSAGIYGVVTRPEARHLGLARILTLTAVYAARRSGYRLAVLHSSPMAEGLYKSLGFETVASFRLFASEEAHI